MNIKMKAAIIDTETTGLLKHPHTKQELQPRIIEYACLIIDETGKVRGSYSKLIDPEELITEEITKITGITNDDLKGKPRFKDVYKEINTMMHGVDVVIAHNMPFDKGMLTREFALLGKRMVWPAMEICTVQENIPVYGHRIRQGDLYEKLFGRKMEKAHRALDDCQALAEIVVKLGYLKELA